MPRERAHTDSRRRSHRRREAPPGLGAPRRPTARRQAPDARGDGPRRGGDDDRRDRRRRRGDRRHRPDRQVAGAWRDRRHGRSRRRGLADCARERPGGGAPRRSSRRVRRRPPPSTGRLSFGVSSAPRAAPAEALPPIPDVEALLPLPEVEAPIDPTPPVHATPSPTRILARRVEATRPADLPASLAPAPPDVPNVPTVPSAPASDDTLTAEVTALDEARRVLAAGDPGAALLSLDAYDRRFASRRLGPEAAVLRVEALIAAGRFGQAHQLGEQLLAAEPDGAYAQHVRSILSRASQ